MATGSQEDRQYNIAAFFTNLREIPKKDDNQPGTGFVTRSGAEKDKEMFEEIFWNILDFEPFTGDTDGSSVENLTLDLWKRQDCRENCEECWVCKIKARDFSSCKYVLLGFSSHGHEEIVDGVHQPVILLSDGEILCLSDILKVLSVESNPTLADKPRIVILLGCRAIAKEAERFEVEMPPDSNFVGDVSIKLERVGLSDSSVKFTVETKADVLAYDIRWTKQGSNSNWNSLMIQKNSETDRRTILPVGNLDRDASYCFIVREKTSKGFSPFSDKFYVRTSDAEDDGAEIHVQDGKQEPHLPGNDVGDPNKSFKVYPVTEGELELQKNVKPEKKLELQKNNEYYSAENLPNNFLVVYGANKGRVNKRHEKTGSWVLDDLLQVLRQEKDELSMLHLLTKTAFRMSLRNSKNTEDESLSNKKGILCFSHTLTENVILRKKKIPVPTLPAPQLSLTNKKIVELSKLKAFTDSNLM